MTVLDEEHPDGDIEIVFSGLRPGEKLFEELLVGGDVSGTEHPRIMRAVETYIPFEKFQEYLVRLSDAVTGRDCAWARQILLELVGNYRPTSDIDDLIWKNQNKELEQPNTDNITDISVHLGKR
jgi:FlaA1/EpsC-like NDP-sugar epimerase